MFQNNSSTTCEQKIIGKELLYISREDTPFNDKSDTLKNKQSEFFMNDIETLNAKEKIKTNHSEYRNLSEKQQ